MDWALGIDFGTSRSAGAIGELRASGGGPETVTVSPLEIEGNRWVPSMVLRTPEGELVLGTAADNLAGVHPDRVERTPKRSLGTGAPLLLGGEAVDPRDAAAAVMRMIAAEGRLRSGATDPASTVLTHPVRWADVRRDALRESGERAGLGDVHLVEEPVAAAIHYAAEHVPVGAHVGIYDLGGGTFDTAVLQRTDDGFEVIGVPGGDENIGGENFDHRLFRYFGSCLAETAPELWDELLTSEGRKWKRAALDLLVQARRAKEALSSYTSTQVFVPIADRDILVNRSQFESMIIEDIERTVDLMEDTVVDAGLSIADLTSVFLVGGSSRVPLVAQLVTERFGTKVVTRDEPKAVVALGAARLAALRLSRAASPASPTDAAVGAEDDWLNRLPPPRTEQRLDATPTAATAAAPPPASPAAPPWSPAPRPPSPAAPLRSPAAPLRPPAPTPPPPTTPAPPPPTAGFAAVVGALAPRAAGAAPQQVGVAWRIPLGGPSGQLAADGDAIVFGSRDGVAHCVDPRKGEVRWRAPLGGGVWAAPALADDVVVVATLDGHAVALDRQHGTVRWRVDLGAAIHGAPAIAGGLVVVGTDGGRVVGLERSTGATRWELPVDAAVRADIVVAGSTAFVGTVAGQCFAVETATGRCRWGYRTSGAITDAAGVEGDRILVPCRDGVAYGLRVSNGSAVYGIRCSAACATPIAMAGGTAALIDEAGVMRVHDIGSGRELAAMTVAGAQAPGLVLYPSIAPSRAIVETGAGQVVAIDLLTQGLSFSLPTGSGNRIRPVLSGGIAAVGTTFGQLYGIVL